MKKNKRLFGMSGFLPVCLAALGLVLNACPTEPEDAPSGNAEAQSITVAGKAVTLAAPSAKWSKAEAGEVGIDTIFMSGAEIVVEPAEASAAVKYAKVARYSDDPVFGSESRFDIQPNEYIYVQITASGGNVRYYFFQVKTLMANFALNRVSIGGVAAKLGAPGASASIAGTGTAGLTTAQAASPLAIAVTKDDEGQQLRFAKASGEAEPVFETPEPLEYQFANGDYLYIEVTEKNGEFTNIYKIKIVIGSDDATLTAPLKIGTNEFNTLGTPNADFTLATKTVLTLAAPELSVTVNAAPTDSNAGVKYKVSRTDLIEEPGFNFMTEFSFENGSNWLDIQVTAENGALNYYRYRVNVGSADNSLASITIGTDSLAPAALGTVNEVLPNAVNTASPANQTISLNGALTGAKVTAVPTDANAAVRYAITRSNSDMPVFGSIDTFDFALTNTWLYVEVVAQNGVAGYYKYLLRGSNVNTLTGTSISIGGQTANYGTPNITAVSAAAAAVLLTAPLANAKIVASPTNSGASVSYGIAPNDTHIPTDWTKDTFDFPLGSTWLYVRVTAASGDVTYYRFRVAAGSSGNSLNTVSAGTQSLTPGTPNANSANAVAVEVLLAAPLSAAAISATGSDGAAIKYGTSSSDAVPSVYYNIGDDRTLDFGYGSTWIFFEVTAENGSAAYYKFVLRVGSADKNLTSLSVKNVTVANLGTPGDTQNVTAANRGAVSIPGPLGADTAIIAAASASTTVEWASAAEFWGSMYLNGDFGAGPVTFGQSGYFNYNLLIVRVTSQNGVSDYYVITVSAAP
jgi:threonine dehydrogenase-like Zn-dependent dehydrogenase